MYFSLRDEESTVKAVMFQKLAERLRFVPVNGMLVIAAGSVGIYPEGGIFQMRVTDMLLQGEGGIHRGLTQRKKILQQEGIFETADKKTLPEHPRKIGLITSQTSAALQDMLQILKRRSPYAEIQVFPVHVQGKRAETEICQALAKADTQDCDVLILGRGGGSAEDLHIFNSEKIAKAVHSCQTPVISAVGHETDFTLTDEAADVRASTPSAAAELATSEMQKFPKMISEQNKEIISVQQLQNEEVFKIFLPDGSMTVKVISIIRKEQNQIMNSIIRQTLENYAERIEAYMLSATQVMQKQAEQQSMHIQKLFDAIRHSLTGGGKRIRPALIYEFCRICGGDLQAADAAACAMEMTHTSSLIFDDMPAMDNDDMRRGKPSCHKAFGEAAAILAGDALICAPFMIICEDKFLTPEQKIAVMHTLAEREGTSGMIGGQMMDMQFETQAHVTIEELEVMCLGKTGALMQAACHMGCICGGGTPQQIQAAGNYGNYLGLAFQIMDDILDVTSTSAQLGKPVGSDAEENKQTFVTLLGIEKAKKRAVELTAMAHQQLDIFSDTAFLHTLTDELLNRVQ